MESAVPAALAQLTTQQGAQPPNTAVFDETITGMDWSWETLPTDTAEDRVLSLRMLNQSQKFLNDMLTGEEPYWLVLLGEPGCGKTHLADKIRWFIKKHGERTYNAKERPKVDPERRRVETCFIYKQEGPVLVKWGSLIDKLRDGGRWDFSRACGDHYKVIDDLGVDSFSKNSRGELEATPFATQKIGELLDRRLGKWTVITANFSIEQFGTIFDTRIASRLLRKSSVVKAFGLRDYALEKHKAQRP